MEKNGNRPKRNQANTADSTTSNKKKDKKVDSAGMTAAQANSAKIEEIDAYTASAGGMYTAKAPTSWYIFDSGASEHMTPHRHLLTEYEVIAPIPINAANNSSFNAVGRGYLSVEVPNGHGKTRLKLKDVLYTPGMHMTLVSLGKLDAAGFSSTISGNTLLLQRAGRTYATILRKASLYSVGAYSAQASAEPTVIKLTLDQLHHRLGHRNHKAILKMYTEDCLPGIKLTSRDSTECRDCLLSKATQAPIAAKRMSPLAAKFGDHVHLDVWGPATIRSLLEHAHYVLIIMDDVTRWAEAPPMQHKFNAFAKYVAWEAHKELHSDVHVKINQSDCGGEFLSNDWEMYLQRKGTIRKLTVHDTPEHNSVAERFWRTIFNGVRSLLSASGLPCHLWAEALRWAVWIYNRSPHTTLDGKSPFKKRYSSPPDLSRAWEWGIWVYVHRPAGKLETYASEGRWIGLDDTSNGHRIYWTDRRTITIEHSIRPSTHPMRVNEGEQDHLDIGPEDSSDVQDAPGIDQDDEEVVTPPSAPPTAPVPEPVRKSTRKKKPSRKILNIEQGKAMALSTLIGDVPEHYFVQALEASVSQIFADPTTLDEAKRSPNWSNWFNAMKTEISKLIGHKTFTAVDHPGKQHNVVMVKWVYRTKRDADGKPTSWRARLVARGFSQINGIDYHMDNTFTAVAKMTSICYLLAIAAWNDWPIHQINIKSAYLYGKLNDDEEIYINPPPGIDIPGVKPRQVLHLRLALYGLKQAGRRWYMELRCALLQIDFKWCEHDHAVFVHHYPDKSLAVLFVHVDNMAIIAPTKVKMKVIKDKISKAFEITDNGALHWMLGVSIRHEAKTLKISQAAYIHQILTRFELADIQPLSIPVDPNVAIVANMGEPVSSRKFREMLGAIMYTSIWTRPDLAYAINRLACYQDKPCTRHHTALLRLYAYLKYTVDFGITYSPTRMPLSGYADADGMTTEGRHAVSGYVFCIDGRAISWSSKRQELVTLSTNKAEYVTLTHAAKEAIWLSML
jgi:hypothetical protein